MSALIRQLKYLLVPAAVLGVVTLTSAMRPAPGPLEQVLVRGELVVATRPAPTTYYQDQYGETGLDYELAAGFANTLGVNLRILEADTLDELFALVHSGKADMAAAGLSITPERRQRLAFSTAYQTVQEKVVHRMGILRVRGPEDLSGLRGVVMAGSSHAERLSELASELEHIEFETLEGASAERLLTLVDEGLFDYTLIDSNAYAIHRPLFPELVSGFDAGEAMLGWAFRKHNDGSLRHSAQRYLTRAKADGTVAALDQRFYSHQDHFNLYAARSFIQHLDSRLPQYTQAFIDAGEATGFDWRMLAALGYQESMWDADAVSPTGVRGLMMLTLRTAREMGVADRTDPYESIHAGAAYLRKIYDRIPERIAEPDRTWFALAAYNAGFGHMEDARVLTQRKGGNPDLWADVEQHMPKLRQARYYQHARHGYASGGGQAVIYVRAIRGYYDTLVWAGTSERHNRTMLAMVD